MIFLSNFNQSLCMQVEPQRKINFKIITFRLYPATEDFPLALLPIANKPLLCYQIEYL